MARDEADLPGTLEEIAREMARARERGTPREPVADEAGRFGIAVMTCDGALAAAGDADAPFPIQSVSKVFALALALESCGDAVWERVGREPSGDPYNSIVDLERHRGVPRNPFINSGALVTVDHLLRGRDAASAGRLVRDWIAALVGEPVPFDEEVLAAGGAQYVNRALASLCKHYGNLEHEVDDVLAAYVRQCAVALTCRQLARAGRPFMLERVEDDDEESLARARRARRIGALMITCGQYDGSGDFAFRVGLPAKSGVAGAILAIVPNRASIAVWSPGLDDNGNSLLGTRALELLCERMDWSIFGATSPARPRTRG